MLIHFTLYSKFKCNVLGVLDEMVYLEFMQDETAKKNTNAYQWIDTDKSLSILGLYGANES